MFNAEENTTETQNGPARSRAVLYLVAGAHNQRLSKDPKTPEAMVAGKCKQRLANGSEAMVAGGRNRRSAESQNRRSAQDSGGLGFPESEGLQQPGGLREAYFRSAEQATLASLQGASSAKPFRTLLHAVWDLAAP
jgi:hypothetical protein